MRKIIVLAAILAALPALAQTPDPQIGIYANLLSEANGRIVSEAAQLQQSMQKTSDLQAKLDALQKDYDALKAKASPAPAVAQ